MFRGQSLLIEPVTSFVQDSKEGLRKIFLVIAGGKPAVGRAESAAKRMCSCIDAPGIEVKAYGCGHFAVKRLLRWDRVVAREKIVRNRTRTLERRFEQGNDGRAKFGK